jgi:hypothetical protein
MDENNLKKGEFYYHPKNYVKYMGVCGWSYRFEAVDRRSDIYVSNIAVNKYFRNINFFERIYCLQIQFISKIRIILRDFYEERLRADCKIAWTVSRIENKIFNFCNKFFNKKRNK